MASIAIMPDLFSFAGHHNEDSLQEMVGDEAAKLVRRNSLFDRMPFRKIGSFLKHHRDHHVAGTERAQEYLESSPESLVRRPSLLDRVSTERAVPSLPRPQTFRRQQSEQRERLLEVPSTTWEKRAVSADRKRGLSTGAKRPRSPKPIHIPSLSAPEVGSPDQHASLSPVKEKSSNGLDDNEQPANDMGSDQVPDEPPLIDGEPLIDQDDESVAPDRNSLQDELDQRWILNLSMHFRDKSDREKILDARAYDDVTTRMKIYQHAYIQGCSMHHLLGSIHLSNQPTKPTECRLCDDQVNQYRFWTFYRMAKT